MKQIVYLLHRFPGKTDTFIKREILSLRRLGVQVKIVSIWKPGPSETTPEALKEWSKEVEFILPRVAPADIGAFFAAVFASPKRLFEMLGLAFSTRRPGLRGFVYQTIYLAEALLAAGRLRRLKVEHIHNHFGDHSGLVTMLAAKLIGAEYSISIHGPHVFMDPRYAAFKEKVDNAQFIRCISFFCRSQMIVFSECSDISKFKVVHCGLDLDRYEFRPPRKQVKRLFCAARLSQEKGLEFLVHALAILRGRGHKLELRLAGDGAHRGALEKIAASLGISGHVAFLGNLGEAQITRELTEADIFVLPSLAEGVPVSLMEAMAIGVPVIATNVAGTSELVEDGRNGILVRPTDAEALGDAVAKIIGDYDLRLRASKEGRVKVGKEFDIDVETAKLCTYLTSPRNFDPYTT